MGKLSLKRLDRRKFNEFCVKYLKFYEHETKFKPSFSLSLHSLSAFLRASPLLLHGMFVLWIKGELHVTPQGWVQSFERLRPLHFKKQKEADNPSVKKFWKVMVKMDDAAYKSAKISQKIDQNNIKLRSLDIKQNLSNFRVIETHISLLCEQFELVKTDCRIVLKKMKFQSELKKIIDAMGDSDTNTKLLMVAAFTDWLTQQGYKFPGTAIIFTKIAAEKALKYFKNEALLTEPLSRVMESRLKWACSKEEILRSITKF